MATLDLYFPRGEMRLSFLGLVVLPCLALYQQPESLLCFFFFNPFGIFKFATPAQTFPSIRTFLSFHCLRLSWMIG